MKTAPRGHAFENDAIVPTTDAAVYFDDPPEPDDATRAAIFRAVCDMLTDGPGKSVALRLAALRRIAGHDQRPLRDIAADQKVSVSTLHAAIGAIRTRLQR
jgi:hypothetical protein